MRKVLSFSLFLMLGLVASQLLPGLLGPGYSSFKATTDTLLYVCLGFIMINVGREFEIDKSRWRSYTADYFIAMATAALPWLLIVLYYVFVLLPAPLWSSPEAWKENLLLSRFAAPTSAGILFTMLAALKLKESWIYRKIQVLAIFDDLDTILLMIPLQILMIGLRWQMFAIVAIVAVLLAVGWRWQATWDVRQDWKRILGLSVIVCALTQAVYLATKHWYGAENSIHIEVLLPAFVVGMLMRHRHIDTPAERRVATGVSFLFMLLVGLSMPLVTGSGAAAAADSAASVTASQPMMPWGILVLHVLAVSLLSNLGKLVPLFFYLPRPVAERAPCPLGGHVHARGGRRRRHLHRPGLQPRRPGTDRLGADAGAQPDPHGRLRRLGQAAGPEELYSRKILTHRTMRRLLSVILAVLASFQALPARSQNPERNLIVVHGGANIAFFAAAYDNLSGTTSPRAGYYAGVTDHIRLHRRIPLYIGTGLLFSSRGGRYMGFSARPMYLQVPLTIDCRIRCSRTLSIIPTVGAWYGAGIGGKLRHNDGWAELYAPEGPMRRSDVGLRIGVALGWGRFRLEAGYEPGLRNLARPDATPTTLLPVRFTRMHSHCFTIGLGCEF